MYGGNQSITSVHDILYLYTVDRPPLQQLESILPNSDLVNKYLDNQFWSQ